MTLIEDIVGWLKNQAVYMTGRGLIGLGMVAADFVGGPLAMGIAVGSTALLQAALTWRKERRAERSLLNAYREEVAASLGVGVGEVGLQQLHEVAEENPVLQEALDRNSKKHFMQMVTSGIAAIVTFGLAVTVLEAMGITGGLIAGIKGQILEITGLEWLSHATAAAGVLTIAGTGMSIFNQIFDRIGARMLNIHKSGPHDLIVGIHRDVSRGRMVSREQVFAVFVAAQPDLAQAIEKDYGRPYDRLRPRQQYLALSEYGSHLPIHQLTYDINELTIKPQELAFAAVGQESGVAPRYDVNFREAALKEKSTAEYLAEIKEAAIGDLGKKKPAAPEEEQAPANDNAPGFADRFVPRQSMENQSFVERYAPERKNNQLERVLQQLREREAGGDERGL